MATMKKGVKKLFRKFFKKLCCCCRSSSDDEDTYAGTSLGSPATVRKGSPLSSLVSSRSSESVFQSCNTSLTSTSQEASIVGHKENDLTKANVLIGDAGKDGEETSSSDESNADHLTKANVLLGGAGKDGEETSSSEESNADHLTKANVLLGGAGKDDEETSSDESNADHLTKQEAKSIQQAEADTISSIVVKDEASTSPPAVSAADDKGLEIQHSTVPSAVSFVTESSTTGLHKPNAGGKCLLA
ncbi:uncharacterized protein LOC142929689 [Petromyzon marinus]|uniref:uncharacterized protein LOC142929689 n=1 Tax=Petromyzon marinus TaxID=7757 RepID=UPI003F6FA223